MLTIATIVPMTRHPLPATPLPLIPPPRTTPLSPSITLPRTTPLSPSIIFFIIQRRCNWMHHMIRCLLYLLPR